MSLKLADILITVNMPVVPPNFSLCADWDGYRVINRDTGEVVVNRLTDEAATTLWKSLNRASQSEVVGK